MNPILLIHWSEAEAKDRLQRLRKSGFSPLILTSLPNGPAGLRRLLEKPLDAIVIDRGLGLRNRKDHAVYSDCFCGRRAGQGQPRKDRSIRRSLHRMAEDRNGHQDCDLESAGQSASAEHHGWVLGHTTSEKAWHQPGTLIALVNAPDAFERTLDPLPDGVLIKEDLRGKTDLVVLFASRMAEICEQLPRTELSLNEGGRLWIAWPKQASGVKTDVTQPAVREFGLAAGWVDFKICAIDETWSGLAFARRNAKANRAAR